MSTPSAARARVSENAAPAGGPDFAALGGIAVAANGDILVTDTDTFDDFGGGVIRVDPVSGARTTVSRNAAPAGGPDFVDAYGIALAADGDILVADQFAFNDFHGGVIGVDRASGARTTVSSNSAPAGGPSFGGPFGIALAGTATSWWPTRRRLAAAAG